MFKKHVFTCPDVIYLMNRQKKIQRGILTGYAVAFGSLYLYGKHLTKKEQESSELTAVMDAVQE